MPARSVSSRGETERNGGRGGTEGGEAEHTRKSFLSSRSLILRSDNPDFSSPSAVVSRVTSGDSPPDSVRVNKCAVTAAGTASAGENGSDEDSAADRPSGSRQLSE